MRRAAPLFVFVTACAAAPPPVVPVTPTPQPAAALRCAEDAKAPSQTVVNATAPKPAPRDRAWLTSGEGIVLSVEEERRQGYGADFVSRRLEVVVGAAAKAPGTATSVTRGVGATRSAPRGRAASVLVHKGALDRLLAAMVQAHERATTPSIVVVASDTYRRVVIRARTVDDTQQIELFTAPSDRSDLVWHLRGDPAAVELEPEELTAALEGLRPWLDAADAK